MKNPDYSYQNKLIENTIRDLKTHKKVVMACAPNAGKTNMAIEIIDKLAQENSSFKAVVFCHGQVIIREQWASRMETTKPSLKYSVLRRQKYKKKNPKPLENIIFALPQTLKNLQDNLSVDLVIVDEAHQRYKAIEMQALLKKIKPKMQLMLTGSPAVFIEEKGWKIHGIALDELLSRGVATDPLIEIAKFDYKVKPTDYLGQTGEIKNEFKFQKKQTKSSLDNLLETLVIKLVSKKRAYPGKYMSKVGRRDGWSEVISKMDKTMIVAKNQIQARDIAKYFSDVGIGTSLSISDNDSDSGVAALDKFKKDRKCKVFVVVSRGILGFDYSELFNIIDMSGTKNVDRLFQLLCRAVRLSKHSPGKKKMFIKLTNKEMQEVIYWTMSYVVALSLPDFYYTQKKYPTLRIPVKKEFVDNLGNERGLGFKKSKEKDELTLPKLLTFNDLRENKKGILNSIAYTDLATVREKIGHAKKLTHWTLGAAIKKAKEYPSRTAFTRPGTGALGAYSFLVKCGYDIDSIFPLKQSRKLSVEDCRNIARKFKSRKDFRIARYRPYLILKAEDPGFLEEIFPGQLKVPPKLTLEYALSVMKDCKMRSDLYTKSYRTFKYMNDKHPDILNAKLPSLASPRISLEEAVAAAQKAVDYGIKSRYKFQKSNRMAYRVISDNNPKLFDEFFPRLKAKPYEITVESITNLAKACSSRTDFHNKYSSVSSRWFKKLSKSDQKKVREMLDVVLPKVIGAPMSVDEAAEIAKKFSSRREMSVRCTKAYNILLKHPKLFNKVLPCKSTGPTRKAS